jgi:hypothetical protein
MVTNTDQTTGTKKVESKINLLQNKPKELNKNENTEPIPVKPKKQRKAGTRGLIKNTIWKRRQDRQNMKKSPYQLPTINTNSNKLNPWKILFNKRLNLC